MAQQEEPRIEKAQPERRHLDPKRVLAAMGPGMVAALAGADAGGVATYSSAGALFGYGQLWTVPVMCLLLIVAQETAARMGCVTGKGFASLIREQFGVRMSTLAMLALLISNTTVTLSEFAGIASGFALFGISRLRQRAHCGGGHLGPHHEWLLSPHREDLAADQLRLRDLRGCRRHGGPRLGRRPQRHPHPALLHRPPATSAFWWQTSAPPSPPGLIFLAQSNVVEKNARAEDLPDQRIDTVTGSVVASAISWFIILTTGAVLFPAGIAVNGAEDAASALAPLVGPYAEALFGAGLVGASFLAACVLPGITSSAICEAFGWERGADRSWQEAPVYRGIITAIIYLSAVIVIVPNVNLFGIMMLAQVINGVLLPVLLVFMVLIAGDRHVMGRFANGRIWNGLTWFTIIAVVVLTIVMFVLQAMGL